MNRGKRYVDSMVSFSDLVHWIQDGGEDEHWQAPYHHMCHPCIIQYDRIVKLETQNTDAQFIIKEKLDGRGEDTRRNKRDFTKENNSKGEENAFLRENGKYLDIYNNCTDDQMLFLRKRFQSDLEMFGYSFDENNLVAKCGYDKTGCC